MPELDLKSLTIIGLELIKKNSLPPTDDDLHDGLSSTAFRTWRSNYGHRPRVIYDAWCLIEDEMYEEKCKPKHFFWALHFMKSYDVEDNLAPRFGVTPKTFRKRVKQAMQCLAQRFYTLVSGGVFLLFIQ